MARCKSCHKAARPTYDPEKAALYRQSPKGREKRKATSKKAAVAARKRNGTIALKMKEQACVDCREHFPPEAMDFDHVRGEKRFQIAEAMHHDISVENFMSEIEKCDIVCAFCHRMRTFLNWETLRKPEVKKDMRRIRRRRAVIDEIKGSSPCSKCGRFGHPCQMDFDHIDPSTKTRSVSELICKRATMESIMAEVAKCRVLCATCHRVVTKEQREQDPKKFFAPSGGV